MRPGEVLDGRALSREELIEAIVARPGLEHLSTPLRSGWGTLLKPLAWQGDLVFGESRGSRVTFTHPTTASRQWQGIPDVEAAAPLAMATYFGAYGPTTVEAFAGWLAGGWFGKRRNPCLVRWLP